MGEEIIFIWGDRRQLGPPSVGVALSLKDSGRKWPKRHKVSKRTGYWAVWLTDCTASAWWAQVARSLANGSQSPIMWFPQPTNWKKITFTWHTDSLMFNVRERNHTIPDFSCRLVDNVTWALFSSKKFYKIFQILRHIESLDTCMKH
jgi:hypothetical protein